MTCSIVSWLLTQGCSKAWVADNRSLGSTTSSFCTKSLQLSEARPQMFGFFVKFPSYAGTLGPRAWGLHRTL